MPGNPERNPVAAGTQDDTNVVLLGAGEYSDHDELGVEPPSYDHVNDTNVLRDDFLDTPPDDPSGHNKASRGWTKSHKKMEKNAETMPKRRKLSHPSRRHRELRRRGEELSELMYEMEEGGESSQSPSRNSSEVDLQTLAFAQGGKIARRRRLASGFAIHAGIVLLFLLLLYAAHQATLATRSRKAVTLLSNGTSLFAPTTIVISLDGFRADFLQRGLTPTLNSFIQEGISPLYMQPVFPSVTFANHYTLVTGLYPQHHGIVGNTFWDPDLKQEFYYTNSSVSMLSKWWGGEPVWVSAETQEVKTAIHMWPGSEAHIGGIDLSYVDKFNQTEQLDVKVKKILGWLDLPGPKSVDRISESPRPRLILAYVPNVDSDGHLYGPNSTEIRATIRAADDMLRDLFDGIRERNLTDIVNVIVVSDHGMATTSTDRLMQLDDLIDVDKIEHIDGWPLYGLRPKSDEDLDGLYQQLRKKAEHSPGFDVYLRDKDMPLEYHFTENARIAPLWIVPKTGWAIVKKAEFDIVKAKQEGLVYHPRGIHGYNHKHPLMRAIFVAKGPAFPHKAGSRIEPFQSIEVYNIVCDSIGITPKPNNGTLRLPLRPVGLHSDPDAPKPDTPEDLPSHERQP